MINFVLFIKREIKKRFIDAFDCIAVKSYGDLVMSRTEIVTV